VPIDVSGLEDMRLTTNGVMLNAVAAGPHEGPLVILLHGFPEFWYGWRHQIEPLRRLAFGSYQATSGTRPFASFKTGPLPASG
jgi:pimeloyl-ACP methyl ester carboxylesterase